jgi:glycosyltransferase involved in cell wall biosynthesis
MLEAQAAGLPVVSCAVRGVPEVVIDGVTGLLSADHDVTGMAACLRSLLQDPARRLAMGVRASEFVAVERSLRQASIRLQQALAGLSCAVSLAEVDS